MAITSTPATTTTDVAQTVGNPDALIGVKGTAPEITIGNAAAKVGFYGTAPLAKQTGVAVSAAGVHAALVALGLIAA